MKKPIFLVSLCVSLALSFIPSALFSQDVTPSGSFSYSYPISLPAGRNGMSPSLGLAYNSGTGNGMLGMGWSISGLSVITRDVSYPVTFSDTSDHFLLDGQRLIAGGDGKYHTERESYVLIDFCSKDTSSSYWIVTLKNGTKMYYGYTAADNPAASDGHIDAIGKSGKALLWCLTGC